MRFPFRLAERLQTLREHYYSHIPIGEKLSLIDDKLLLLLNQTVDIREIKPATGTLRLAQELEVQILRLIGLYANKAGIKFWLHFGTLLGAVRHGGFVPWDDDLDIGMMQDDFDRFCALLEKGLPEGLSFDNWISSDGEDIGIARVKDLVTGAHIDLYAHNRVEGAVNANGETTEWEKAYQKEFACIAKETYVKRLKSGYAERISRWEREHSEGDGDSVGLATSMKFVSARPIYRRVYLESDIFPLRETLFEGCPFWVPAKSEVVLEKIYGDYLRFPRDAGHQLHFDWRKCPAIQLRRRVDELTAIVVGMSRS